VGVGGVVASDRECGGRLAFGGWEGVAEVRSGGGLEGAARAFGVCASRQVVGRGGACPAVVIGGLVVGFARGMAAVNRWVVDLTEIDDAPEVTGQGGAETLQRVEGREEFQQQSLSEGAILGVTGVPVRAVGLDRSLFDIGRLRIVGCGEKAVFLDADRWDKLVIDRLGQRHTATFEHFVIDRGLEVGGRVQESFGMGAADQVATRPEVGVIEAGQFASVDGFEKGAFEQQVEVVGLDLHDIGVFGDPIGMVEERFGVDREVDVIFEDRGEG
jgi:hypothetical protein